MASKPLFPVLQEEELEEDKTGKTGNSSLVRKDEIFDTSWLKNESAAAVPEQKVESSEDSDSSPWEIDEEEEPEEVARKKKRKRKRKSDKSEKKDRRKRRMLTDREKIMQIEEKLTNLEKHKKTRNMRLYYWGNDFDVDVDVRKQDKIWENSKKKNYVIDRMGNNDNLLYEQLYRLDIVKYKTTHDFFIGNKLLPQFMVRMMLKDKGAGEIPDEVRQSANVRYFATKYQLKDRDRGMKRIYMGDKDSVQPEEIGLFVSLGSLNDSKAWKDAGKTTEERQIEKIRSYSSRLRTDPDNVNLWFEFIRFQDESTMKHRAAKMAPLAEKKLSIFEKAMEANPGNVPLILGYLDLCRRHCTPNVMREKWSEMLSSNQGSSRLWKEHLLFQQSEFELFGVSKAVSAYENAVLRLKQQGGNSTLRRRGEVTAAEAALVSILVRYATFQRQAGFYERSIALLQANLEFNLFCPEELENPEQRLRFFEAFWDSDCPRIGDKGAPTFKGWYKKQLENQEQMEEKSYLEKDETQLSLGKEDMKRLPTSVGIKRWVENELRKDEVFWQPLTGDSADLDDEQALTRIVLLDDIKPFLCPISNLTLLSDIACQLLFLLGVSTRVIGGHYRLSSYQFSVERAQELERFENVPGLDGEPVEIGFFDVPVKNSKDLKDASMFPEKPPSEMEQLASKGKNRQLSKDKIEFCRRLFVELTNGPLKSSLSIRCAYIAFEAQYDCDTATAVAKEFLKADQLNLRLWNAFSQLQKLFGKIEEACRIYKKALTLVPKLSAKSQRNAPLLFWSFAEIQIFNVKDSNAAQHILVSAPFFKLLKSKFKKRVKTTAIVKARNMYLKLLGDKPKPKSHILESKWDNSNFDARVWSFWSVAAGRSEERSRRYLEVSPGACLGLCFVWMEYIREGLDSARKIFDHHILSRVRDAKEAKELSGSITRGSFQHEWLHMQYARMVSFHSLLNPTPPRVLRSIITSGLRFFPTNAYLLNMFTKTEGEMGHMTTRVRRHFDSVLDNLGGALEISPVLWMYAIVWELPRAGARHRIISLFEKALRGRSRTNVALWRLYIRYLVSIGYYDSAKSTYYRAFNQCPWSKLLWLGGMKLLYQESENALEHEEFIEIIRLMGEKEVRLHNDEAEGNVDFNSNAEEIIEDAKDVNNMESEVAVHGSELLKENTENDNVKDEKL